MPQSNKQLAIIFNEFKDSLFSIELSKKHSLRLYKEKERKIKETLAKISSDEDKEAGQFGLFLVTNPLTNCIKIINYHYEIPLSELSHYYSIETKLFGFYSLLRMSESFDFYVIKLYLEILTQKKVYAKKIISSKLYKQITSLLNNKNNEPPEIVIKKHGLASPIFSEMFKSVIKEITKKTSSFDSELYVNYAYLIFFSREFRHKTAHNLFKSNIVSECLQKAQNKIIAIEQVVNPSHTYITTDRINYYKKKYDTFFDLTSKVNSISNDEQIEISNDFFSSFYSMAELLQKHYENII